MSQSSPPRKPRKLLAASIGVGALVFASCAIFPGCNLLAPPCDTQPLDPRCYGPDLGAEPPDLSEHD